MDHLVTCFVCLLTPLNGPIGYSLYSFACTFEWATWSLALFVCLHLFIIYSFTCFVCLLAPLNGPLGHSLCLFAHTSEWTTRLLHLLAPLNGPLSHLLCSFARASEWTTRALAPLNGPLDYSLCLLAGTFEWATVTHFVHFLAPCTSQTHSIALHVETEAIEEGKAAAKTEVEAMETAVVGAAWKP